MCQHSVSTRTLIFMVTNLHIKGFFFIELFQRVNIITMIRILFKLLICELFSNYLLQPGKYSEVK